MSKKEQVASAVLDARLNMEIKEQEGQCYVNNLRFDNVEELDKYIDSKENLMLLIRVVEELGLEYGFDENIFTIFLQ